MKYIISGICAITMLFAVYVVTSFNDIVIVKTHTPEESCSQHAETEPYVSEYEDDEVEPKVEKQPTDTSSGVHGSDASTILDANVEKSVAARDEVDPVNEQTANVDAAAENASGVAVTEDNENQVADALIEAEANNSVSAETSAAAQDVIEAVAKETVVQAAETQVAQSPGAPTTKSLHQPAQAKPVNLMVQNTEVEGIQAVQVAEKKETVNEKSVKIETPIAELTEKMIQWPTGKQRIYSKSSSYKELFGLWDLDYNSAKHGSPCAYAIEQGFSCHRDRSDIENLREFNRPAVLTLYNEDNQIQYVTLKEINENEAKLVIMGKEQIVSLSELKRYWKGDYQFFWNTPEGYFEPIMPGDSGRAVLWLSRRMLEINNHPGMVPHDYYDKELLEQIKAFQSDHGLDTDGIVGIKTLIHINQASSQQVPLLESS